MSEKKNIDKLFKEQLKNFEVAPNDAVWEQIERELHKDKRKRRVIPIWWKVAGVAAVLALLFTVGTKVFNTNTENTLDHDVVNTNTNNSKEDIKSNPDKDETTKGSPIKPSEDSNTTEIVDTKVSEEQFNPSTNTNVSKEQFTTNTNSDYKNSVTTSSSEDQPLEQQSEKNSVVNKSQQREAIASSDKQNKDQTQTKATQTNAVVNNSQDLKPESEDDQNKLNKEQSEIDQLIKALKDSNSTRVSASDNSEKDNASSVIDSSKANEIIKEDNAIETAIAEAQKDKDSIAEAEAPLKRWSVAPNVAPVYFNTLGKGSSLDNQFINNTKEGDVNVSYGVKGSYAISEKLKIRAGINKVDLGYSTNNVLSFDGTSPAASAQQIKNVRLNDSINNSAFVSANNISFATGPEILFTKEQGSISQQLGFIEVPIELEYSLVDKKIGVNLIGGFSTLFLSDNEIYSVRNNGDKTLVGEATNINDMSYSANFGLGVNYNISEKLRFNLEPTFKYQINTFTDTSGDFKPFFIGVYTGLSFKF
ncbi:hypothetical protein [Psychroserpens algicola]|uniref:hypothetical protein n=1 Tax=Psychroserpens algicola TaxID=1719034 RepID=UPI0019539B91|nr:hypothetical protein [Psychroserpens algicola]